MFRNRSNLGNELRSRYSKTRGPTEAGTESLFVDTYIVWRFPGREENLR